MSENARPFCPDCDAPEEALDRRHFIRVLGGQAAGALALTAVAGAAPRLCSAARAAPAPTKKEKPAEALVKELFGGLDPDQKKAVVYRWEDRRRLGMYNGPIGPRIGQAYTGGQQELIDRIIRAIASDEDGYRQLSRNGTWDTRGGMTDCGAYIFGDPSQGKYAWMFTGHHLTVRCDGETQDGVAFGGPMFYGHSPNGYSNRNVFNYQTRAVLSVFDALSEKQRKVAIVPGSPGEQARSVRFRPARERKPGISAGELNKDQLALVETVMRTILAPYRKEDADEVMQIVKANGGLEKIHLAFYQDARMNDKQRWHFWRLEGPGFVWNFRVLPHVHTYVNCCRQS